MKRRITWNEDIRSLLSANAINTLSAAESWPVLVHGQVNYMPFLLTGYSGQTKGNDVEKCPSVQSYPV